MNVTRFLPGLLAYLVTTSVFAVPVDYTFSGQIFSEFDETAQTGISDPAQRIYTDGVIGNLNLTYDSDTPLNSSDNPQFPGIANFGLYSDYLGAGAAVSGNLGADGFSASTADAAVADAPSGGGVLDGFFMFAGNTLQGSSGSGFSGFSINGFNLASFTLYTVSLQDFFLSQALPDELVNGQLATGLNLRFVNQQDPQDVHIVQLAGSITRVPEPLSIVLMTLGMGLLSVRRMRA